MSDTATTKKKGRTRAAKKNTDAAPAAPAEAPLAEPEGIAVMQGLYETLLDQVKGLDGSEITEKKAYARVRVPAAGKLKTVVYVNYPSKKTVRLEFPDGSGGYDVVKVEDEAGVTAAFNRIQTDAAALAAAE